MIKAKDSSSSIRILKSSQKHRVLYPGEETALPMNSEPYKSEPSDQVLDRRKKEHTGQG